MKILRGVGVVLLLGGLFAFGFSWRDLQRMRLPSAETFGQLVGYSKPQAKVAPVRVFRSTYQHIQQEFAGKVNATELKYSGLAGMLASLGDPHTMFLDPDSTREFRLETGGQFAGIGARLGPDQLGARVGIVFEEGPAARAGLKPGDLITGVDGKSVGGEDIDRIVSKIRGPEGTRVVLTIVREGAEQPITLRITRAQVVTPTVTSKVLPEGIGYINISIFAGPTAMQFDKAWSKLDRQGIGGLVIDLRNNPGGLLESVREILSLFKEDKLVVTLKMRDGQQEETITSRGRRREYNYPIVVLVNQDSASAAEIMAGVMRDYGLTTLVGEDTYGKMSVQNVIQFRDGSSAKITIAKYYLPSGDDFTRKVDDDGLFVSGGIKVDVEEKLQEIPLPVFGEVDKDNQLRKAIEVVKSKMRDGKRAISAQAPQSGVDSWPIA